MFDTTKHPLLRPGMIVRLSRDVPNPTPDRRRKLDPMEAPVWKKGMRFYLQSHRQDPEITGAECLNWRDGSIHRSHDGWEAFVAALEPEPPSVRGILEAGYCGRLHSASASWFVDVIERFVERGRVSLDDVAVAISDADNSVIATSRLFER